MADPWFVVAFSIIGVPALLGAFTSYRLRRLLMPGVAIGLALLAVFLWGVATAGSDGEPYSTPAGVIVAVITAAGAAGLWAVGALCGRGMRYAVGFVRGFIQGWRS